MKSQVTMHGTFKHFFGFEANVHPCEQNLNISAHLENIINNQHNTNQQVSLQTHKTRRKIVYVNPT